MPQLGAPILLVEDEADDVEFVRRALRGRKVLNPIVVVADAQQAKAYLADLARRAGAFPAVAIVDILLPGGTSGLDLVHWMRSEPGPLRTMPVIVLTVATDRTYQARASQLAAALFLFKPITDDVLVEAVTSLGLAVAPTVSGHTNGAVIEPRRS